MKVLVMFDYPPGPGGLSTQGDLLYKGLKEIGIEVQAVHLESTLEKQWYYHWFKPDVAIGIGYWGHTPQLVIHPQEHGILPVPWLVADGYIANYQKELNALPLILVTSNWVKEMYVRDGISGDKIEVLPVGCPTDSFIPIDKEDARIVSVRQFLDIRPDQLMILTLGGDAASKGAQEVMQALALIDQKAPDYRYVCKVWPQQRTNIQNRYDMELAQTLGIEKKVIYTTGIISREFMPFLMNACDIYAAPSRLEGFGMPQVEAGACQKPVIGISAMGMLDTLIHGKTALLAKVAKRIVVKETTIETGPELKKEKIIFDTPRTVDYRADINDIAQYLLELMTRPALREQMGKAARERAVDYFNYRKVAQMFVQIINNRLGIY
ncbi:MAG: glycosyltransferase family 4 protein [Candidatus Saccharibacteria bacterium]